ncbi:MAG TPA: efflux RND transporter permease subunit, partial [Spongiibacteraceae bacterium]|nr:efflux RND transporter permease subunit [Spongiibacteraceae bacterium]
GFSVFGAAQNVVHSFVALNPWDERVGPEHSADAVVRRAAAEFSTWNEALAIPLNLPPILELGNASGFSLRLLDRAGQGHAALAAARDQLLAMGSQSPVLASLRSEGLPDAPQLTLVVDREKASALGVGFDAINDVLSTALASAYVNDFPRYGRMSKVIVQAEPRQSAQAQDLLDLFVTNGAGDVVPFSAFATTRWSQGPVQLVRFNGYPAIRIAGDAAPGYSTGEAMAELERMAGQLPAGFDIDWTGQSREERLSESQAPWLFAFSMLSVFLCLAALYESWSVPFAVMLSVPLGIIGSLLAATSFGMSNDVYFKVGLIAIIGLSAKNAILIVEFAQSMQAQGRGLRDAIREACRIRFRPILMTSAAFICGVLPLALASGAGAASQQAIGIGVVGGMLSATALAIFFVPTFFMVVRSWFPYRPRLPAAGQRDAS